MKLKLISKAFIILLISHDLLFLHLSISFNNLAYRNTIKML